MITEPNRKVMSEVSGSVGDRGRNGEVRKGAWRARERSGRTSWSYITVTQEGTPGVGGARDCSEYFKVPKVTSRGNTNGGMLPRAEKRRDWRLRFSSF